MDWATVIAAALGGTLALLGGVGTEMWRERRSGEALIRTEQRKTLLELREAIESIESGISEMQPGRLREWEESPTRVTWSTVESPTRRGG